MKPSPAEIIEGSCVDRLEYRIDDDGRVHVKGAHGIGEHIIDALTRHGYELRRFR